MIPTHQSPGTGRKEIVVNRLSRLNDYDFSEPHRHAYFEFFFFFRGGGVHRIDFQDFSIGDTAIHIVAPGQVHQVERDLDSHGFVCLFELDALAAPSELEAFLFDHICFDVQLRPPAYAFPDGQRAYLEMLATQVESLIEADDPLRDVRIRTLVHALVVECMRAGGHERAGSEQSLYAHFRRTLFHHFREIKKVKEYAEMLGVTEKILNESVRSHAGKSASEVIYDQIILEARRLLLTGMSAKEVAYALGFEDPAHFSKFFKNKTGSSPADFRKVQD